MKVKIIISAVFLLFFVSFQSCKQASKKEDAYDRAISAEDKLLNSKEFNDYYQMFFKLSDNNTKTDLPYVNKFMSENKLWKFKDICELLENEKIKADPRVFKYWEIRCDFQTAKTTLMEKYELDKDSLKILMEHKISAKQMTPSGGK
jgi:hypothetical protein